MKRFLLILLVLPLALRAQSLINIDFGVGTQSMKAGFAATGESANDFWNLYRHYDPKYIPGAPLVPDGQMAGLKLADTSPSSVTVAVTNAPGVWGNASGDRMFDSYIFAQNGSNILVTLAGLSAGRYHLYLYGHADADVTGEQNSVFTVRSGTNVLGPIAANGGTGWKSTAPWIEKSQYVVFRDVPVAAGSPVQIEVAPGPNGVAVLNGLQLISRGTSPPRLAPAVVSPAAAGTTNLILRAVKYTGDVSDTEARFHVVLEAESMTTNEISAPLFDGDVALVIPRLPNGVRVANAGRQYRLHLTAPGSYTVEMDLVARITRAEPWNQISFTGPAAAIASVTAQATLPGIEMQLIGGTQLNAERKATSRLEGFLGADRTVTMRWQSKAAEVSRKSLITVDTIASALVTPTVIKFTTEFRYDILQAPLPRLAISLPASHALTKLTGEQIRDWQVKPDGSRQLLTIEFIRPVEKSVQVTLFSEQTVDSSAAVQIAPPQPIDVERESGSFSISADDMQVDVESTSGLRQVNSRRGALAAWQFHERPVSVTARLTRIEPVVKVSDRATVRLDESRLGVAHALFLKVERAGIYQLDVTSPAGFNVTDVRGDGVEDWKRAGDNLHITFTNRVLGSRRLEIQLEQPLKTFPDQVVITPLRVQGATNSAVELAAASPAGIQLKTADLSGLREVPVDNLSGRTGDELLAFRSDQPDWKLTLATERLSSRVVADVLNLLTIGDGLVGGSATIRFGIFNQGLQQFRVRLPAHWKNVEFTGPHIRRKEPVPSADTNSVVWLIALQDKVWSAYTLVVSYDYQFDPKGALLDLSGAHALDVERETGSIGVMSGSSLKLDARAAAETVRRVDESELPDTDRALATRPLLLAYKYTGGDSMLRVQVTRFDSVQGLDAIADRTELTTVLTEAGQMLTQASFMVKNNEKQFQRFKLPPASDFWSSYVNGQPAKPERDGDWILVPLPRDANRDQAFAVDIVYAQKIDLRKSLFPQRLSLQAPVTDVPNTYAEWQLFVPLSQRLSSFGGNMMVAPYTTYELRDAWREFVQFWGTFIDRNAGAIVFALVVIVFAGMLVAAIRHGMRRFVELCAVLAILAILASMMLPALSKSKARAQRASAVNNLKQIALAARIYANDHGDQFPASFEQMRDELSTDKILTDPSTGQRFQWIGAGKSAEDPQAILAYSISDNGGVVALGDGSVQQVTRENLEKMLQDDARRASTPAKPAAPAYGQAAAVAPALQPPIANAAGTIVVTNATGQAEKVTAAGVRPIRIEIPRSGRAFAFTKVLNVGNEPLAIGASIMRFRSFRIFQTIWQTTAFLIGLLLAWRFWRRKSRSSLGLAIAATLILVSVTDLWLTWRILHLVLISFPPLFIVGFVVWLLVRYWPRSKPPVEPGTGVAAAALITFALWIVPLPSSAASTGSPANAVTIVSAAYNGSVQEKVARLSAAIHLSALSSNQTVPLFRDDVAIEQFSVKSGAARLLRDGRNISVLLTNAGEAELQFKLAAPISGEVSRQQLNLAIPPALASTLDLDINESDADVEFPTAVSFTRTNLNQQTRVHSILGSTDRIELNWTPRTKRAAEIAATVFVQDAALISFGGGVINTRVNFEYQVTQGELRQVRVKIPARQRLLRVDGASIRTWELNPDGTLLTVDLTKGVSPSYQLQVELEQALEKLPATTPIQLPFAMDVKRETGVLAVRTSDELSLSIDSVRDLQRIDTEEFTRSSGRSELPLRQSPVDSAAIIGAFRFLRPGFALAIRAESVQPQIEAVVRNAVRIGFDEVRLDAQVDYAIKRAGVFALRLSVPAGYKVVSITGRNTQPFVERGEGAQRIVEVPLSERASGSYTLTLSLAASHKEVPRTIVIPGVRPLGCEKLSGLVTVTSDVGIATKAESFDSLTEVPAVAAGIRNNGDGGSATLAYRLVGPDPATASAWKLSVTTEAVEPWVRVEVANYITVTEGFVTGRAVLRYDIANAPVKEFRLRIPAGWKNVDINAPEIRRRDQSTNDWRIELQNKVRGAFTVTVTWEAEKSARTNLVEFDGVQALNVERETGFIIVSAKSPIQVSERSAGELLTRIDLPELPDWVERPGKDAVLAWKYVRPGYHLALEVKRFDEAEVLQALVDSARFTTVVADDGQTMTEVSITVRNSGRQYLQVELPNGSTNVWSAFVAGEPVRPNVRNGKLLLPIERTADDVPVLIELTFVSDETFPRHSGSFALQSPKFDVPLKNARWELYLPPDYEYSDFEGSMTKSADTGPVVQVFSAGEYASQQWTKAQEVKKEFQSELSSVRRNLSGGNVKEAVSSYSRAKSRSQNRADENRDLQSIEREVRRAQSSNIIQAQNNVYFENAQRLEQRFNAVTNMPVQQAQEARVDYDADIAAAQWSKVEAAQQVAKAKVTPLHINLPTRGVKLTFSQVLQTEVQKPMTIRLRAANQKEMSWPRKLLWCAGGFLILWIGMAGVAGRRRD